MLCESDKTDDNHETEQNPERKAPASWPQRYSGSDDHLKKHAGGQ
jgi:hypothetical protein